MYAPCESHQGRIPQNRTVCFLFLHLKIRIFNQSTTVELFGKPFQIKNTVFVIEALPSPVQSDILCENYLSDVIPIATSRFNAHQALTIIPYLTTFGNTFYNKLLAKISSFFMQYILKNRKNTTKKEMSEAFFGHLLKYFLFFAKNQ